jgi:hypothetical protein
MNRFKLLGVMLGAVCAMGLMATSAFALPDISVTLGGTYPLHLEYSNATVKTELQNANGGVLHGEGLKVLYLIGELTALGTFRATFSKVTKETEKCLNTGTEANGEVLTEGEFHIVYTSLPGSTGGLQLGILYLLKELTGATEIKCPKNANTIKVKGSVIGSLNLNGTTEATQLTSLKSILNGSKGKANIRTYWNDAGTEVLAKLESNIDGAGFKESNQIVAGEPEAVALESKMFVLTSR